MFISFCNFLARNKRLSRTQKFILLRLYYQLIPSFSRPQGSYFKKDESCFYLRIPFFLGAINILYRYPNIGYLNTLTTGVRIFLWPRFVNRPGEKLWEYDFLLWRKKGDYYNYRLTES